MSAVCPLAQLRQRVACSIRHEKLLHYYWLKRAQTMGQKVLGEGDVTFENIYFGYSNDGVAASEWYAGGGIPLWWSLP